MTAPRTAHDRARPTPSRADLPPAMNRNELWARVLLDELARCGVEEVIVAPGSRCAPLVLAAAADGRFRVRALVDERSAGYLALGVGKATGRPAAVVTTSGTAVANLFPAVVEAAHSETPLLLLTADRPPRLRGADANQTIDQVGIFGDAVRLFAELSPAELSERTLRHLRSTACRAVAAAVGDPAGPVHLNLPFEKPLEPVPVAGDLAPKLAEGRTSASGGRPDGAPWTRVAPNRPAPDRAALAEVAGALERARRPVLVAGVLPRPGEVGPTLRRAAARLGVPILADALSGARFGEEPLSGAGYELILRDREAAKALRPDLVLRTGAAATSQILTDWLVDLPEVPHLLVDAGGRWKDHGAAATEVIRADPGRFFSSLAEHMHAVGVTPPVEAGWLDAWTVARSGSEDVIGSRGIMEPPFEGSCVADIARAVPSDDLLFVSNSMPVRDLDAFVPTREAFLEVHGNRGASGIDGIVSTAAGMSLGTGRRVVAVIGDLAVLHDANGLAALADADVRVLLIVINNDGGGIFHMLPVREHEPAFTPLVATPHGRDLAHLAALHDLPHRRLDLRASASEDGGGPDERSGLLAAIEQALREQVEGAERSMMLEIRTDREENRRRREAVLARAAAAAGEALKRTKRGEKG